MQSTQRDPQRRRVLLFSIDGCRPDALQLADAPTIHALAASGAVAWNARTVMPSCTLPCHTSMLRGVDTPRHGITSNDFHPLVRPVPSLFEHCKAHGLRTAFFLNWEQLRDLAGPGFVDVGCHIAEAIEPGSDEWIASQAIAHREFADADFTFVYLGHTDEVGHRHGWMSQPYLNAIAGADRCISQILDAWQAAGCLEHTTICVVSDHGGHERTHGTDHDDDILIPFILSGAGVERGVSLPDDIRVFDTCCTLAHILRLPQDRTWEGRIVQEALVS